MRSATSTHEANGSSVGHQLVKPVVTPFKADLDLQAIDWTPNEIKKYICDQCLDEFIHESSLTTHLQRRSVRITYLCDKCKANLIFFNRCALLAHIRSHHQNRDQIETILAQVLVQPIDLNQLSASVATTVGTTITDTNCSKESVIGRRITESMSSVYKVKAKAIVKQSDETNCFLKPKPTQNHRIESNKTVNTSSDVISKRYVIKKTSNSELKCSQCNHSFNSLSTREQHLSDKQLVLPLNQCKLCPTICATNCSQSIHNSLHSGSAGIERVCPECGAKLNDSHPMDLMTHLIVNCLHFSRRLVYNCMFCADKMPTLPVMTKHIKSDHTTHHFQCSQCLLQFATDSDLNQHQTDSQCTDCKAIISLKCPICGTFVNSVNTYSDHLTGHRKKFSDFANFVFVCLECNQSFVTKIELKTHLNTNHINNKTQNQEKSFLDELIQRVSVLFKLNVSSGCDKHSNKSNDKFNDKNKDHLSTNNMNCEKRKQLDMNGKNSDLNDISVKRVKGVKTVNESDVQSNCEDNKKSENNTQKATTNDNSLTCSECDLHFPFVQTLKRHLILEHRIHDVESYMSNTYVEIAVSNAVVEPQLAKEVGEERLSKILDSQHSDDTICPICSQKFADSKELKIHGRVHGMAFIKSCQKKSL